MYDEQIGENRKENRQKKQQQQQNPREGIYDMKKVSGLRVFFSVQRQSTISRP